MSSQRLLEQFRRSIEPDDPLRDAHWKRLQTRLVRDAAPHRPIVHGGWGKRWIVATAAAISIAAGILLGLRSGMQPSRDTTAEDLRQQAMHTAHRIDPGGQAVPGIVSDDGSTSPPPASAAPGQPIPQLRNFSRSPRQGTESAVAIDPLASELACMQAAQTALEQGQAEAALRKVAEHAQRFPTGILELERRATEVRALCALGRVDEATRAATRFLHDHPNDSVAWSLARHPCIDDAPKKK